MYLLQPLGGVFFSVRILPEAIRWITYLFPTSYIFEAMRGQLATGTIDTMQLTIGTGVNIISIVAAYLFFRRTYRWSKNSGAFARMVG